MANKRIKLIELRKEKKIKQKDLANYIGVTPRNMRRYETGEYEVPILNAERWGRKLGLSLNQFIKLYKEDK